MHVSEVQRGGASNTKEAMNNVLRHSSTFHKVYQPFNQKTLRCFVKMGAMILVSV